MRSLNVQYGNNYGDIYKLINFTSLKVCYLYDVISSTAEVARGSGVGATNYFAFPFQYLIGIYLYPLCCVELFAKELGRERTV